MPDSQSSLFYQGDLDLDTMALILKLDLSMVKMYSTTIPKIKFLGQGVQRMQLVQADTHTDTHRQYKSFTLPAYAGGI